MTDRKPVQAIVVFRSPSDRPIGSRRERAARLRESTRGYLEDIQRMVGAAGLDGELQLDKELWASGSVLVTATPRALEAIRAMDAVAAVAPSNELLHLEGSAEPATH